MAEIFPEQAVKMMFARLKEMGKRYGIEFNPNSRLANARLALEASEFARDKGRFHEFHEAIFQAYFTLGKDIGDSEVLLGIADQLSLDRQELSKALSEQTYAHRLTEAQAEGRKYGISGTPTYIINDQQIIVGAQPLEVFREALNKLK